MFERTVVIVNPNSKGGQTGKNWDSINNTLKKYFGNDYEIVFTEKSGDGTTIAAKYLELGFKNIIPIGGDGIINEVSNGFFKVNVIGKLDLKDMDNENLDLVLQLDKIKNKILTNMTMAVVSNGSFLGGGFQVAIKANMSDGLLDTVIIKNSDSFKILNKLVNIKKGEESITNENDIYYGQSQTVAIISKDEDNVIISVDGEPIGILPAFFKVFHQFLKIKV